VSDEERAAEAARILKRLDEQSEKITGQAPAPPSEPEREWTERWGRRAGLIIGYLLAVLLLTHLIATYVVR
jgi:hypothetical protein